MVGRACGTGFKPLPTTANSSLQPQHVLHVVDASWFVGEPAGGADGTVGEGVAAAGFVGELDALADVGEDDGVVADDIAAADGVDADLGFGAGSDITEAAVATVGVILQLAHVGEDLDERAGEAALDVAHRTGCRNMIEAVTERRIAIAMLSSNKIVGGKSGSGGGSGWASQLSGELLNSISDSL